MTPMTAMTDDDRLEQLVRSAMPPVAATAATGPSRDLWPAIVNRGRAPAQWSWLDLGVAVGVLIVLLMFPDWLWLLAYHL